MSSGSRTLADFETCADAVSRICRPYRLASPSWREFRGSVRNLTAASLNLTTLNLGRSRMSRDDAQPDETRYYSVLLQLRGAARVLHPQGTMDVAAGDLVLLRSDCRSDVEVSAGTQQIALNVIHESGVARLECAGTESCRRIRAASGPAALLRDSMLSVLRNAGQLGGLDLREHAIDLLLAALCRTPAGPPLSLDAQSLTRYVDGHLHDATLDPQRIAAHFAVSLRQLYRLTAAWDQTPAALIWSRRLQHARQLLASGTGGSVTRIALRCGFKDSGHFSRAYRRAFGESPSATWRNR